MSPAAECHGAHCLAPLGPAPSGHGSSQDRRCRYGVPPAVQLHHRGDADPWAAFDDLTDTPDGRRIAVWIVDNLTEGGRKIAGAMLAHPEGKHTRELAKIGGYNDDGVSSAFRAIAGRFRACAVKPFWNGNPDTKGDARGQLLTVPTNREAYQVFIAVFEARFPEALGE